MAGVLVWGIISTLLLFTVFLVDVGGRELVILAYGAIGLLILLPAGLYLDGRQITAARIEWDPDVTLYVVGGIIGIFLPIISIFVAGLYLNRRHKFVGVP